MNKFERCAWHEGPEHADPRRLPNWFAGRVLWRRDAGDHDAFLLEPIAAEAGAPVGEFTFHPRAAR